MREPTPHFHPNQKHRDNAEQEVRWDLEKSVERLAADVHDELFSPGRSDEHNMLHATKRMASLEAKVAIENSILQSKVGIMTERMDAMTSQMLVLTWAMVGIAIVQLAVAMVPLFKSGDASKGNTDSRSAREATTKR